MKGYSNVRLAATAALAAAMVLGTSACTLFSIQGTLVHYQPSDGTAATIGDLDLRNVIGLSDNGDDVSLLMALVNGGDRDLTVNFQYRDADGEKSTIVVVVEAHSFQQVGAGGTEVVLRNAGATVGGSVDVYVQYGDEQGKQLHIPVLNGETEAYADLLPGPAPTPTETPTPTPTETPVG